MAKLQCPQCGTRITSQDGWAKAALSTLIPAPAIQGMATQIRCPNCQKVFSQVDAGNSGGWSALLPAAVLVAILLAIVLLIQ